jgi:hypothetical protein
MTEDDITQHLIDMLGGGHFVVADDNSFFFHDGQASLPFATLVTKDSDADSASNLNRPGVFRLNIRVSEQTLSAHCSVMRQRASTSCALDRLMPHPTEARCTG